MTSFSNTLVKTQSVNDPAYIIDDIISSFQAVNNFHKLKREFANGLNQTPTAFDVAVFNQPLIIDSFTMENSSKYSM